MLATELQAQAGSQKQPHGLARTGAATLQTTEGQGAFIAMWKDPHLLAKRLRHTINML